MKQIDVNHVLAHLRSAKLIMLDHADSIGVRDFATFGEAVTDAENVVNKIGNEK